MFGLHPTRELFHILFLFSSYITLSNLAHGALLNLSRVRG